tara:strand:+ start:1961 stop:3016 length:1056 start_codon:yes stop_codon:yes gene_type:complete
VPAGQPAWDHDPITGERLGQRMWPDATNYQPDWSMLGGGGTDSGATLEPVEEQNPYGNAVLKVSQAVSASQFYVYKTGLMAQEGGANTFTFAVKPGPGIKTIGSETSSSAALYFRYDVDTGEINKRTDNDVVVKIRKFGFIEFSVSTLNYPSTVELTAVVAAPRSLPGAKPEDYFLTTAWNYNHSDQFEGHIITNGGALARSADVAAIENVDTAPWFGKEAGWFLLRVTPYQNQTQDGYLYSDVNQRLLYNSAGRFRMYDGENTTSPGATIEPGKKYVICGTWSAAESKMKLAIAGEPLVLEGLYNGSFSGMTALPIMRNNPSRTTNSSVAALRFGKQFLANEEMLKKVAS